jgi:hypothetical protein
MDQPPTVYTAKNVLNYIWPEHLICDKLFTHTDHFSYKYCYKLLYQSPTFVKRYIKHMNIPYIDSITCYMTNRHVNFENRINYETLIMLCTKYPNILTYSILSKISVHYPNIFEIYYENNKVEILQDNNNWLSDAIKYIFKNGYVDECINIFKEFGEDPKFIEIMFTKGYGFSLLSSIDILDYIINNFSNKLSVNNLNHIIIAFNYSIDVLHRFAVIGALSELQIVDFPDFLYTNSLAKYILCEVALKGYKEPYDFLKSYGIYFENCAKDYYAFIVVVVSTYDYGGHISNVENVGDEQLDIFVKRLETLYAIDNKDKDVNFIMEKLINEDKENN